MGVELSDKGVTGGGHKVIPVGLGTGKTRTFAEILEMLRNEEESNIRHLLEVDPAVADILLDKSLVGHDVKVAEAEPQIGLQVEALPTPEGAKQTASVSVESNQAAEVAERLLRVLINKKDRESVIGDLFEKYGGEVERRGRRRANLWLYSEVARSVWPLARRLVVRISGRIVRARRVE